MEWKFSRSTLYLEYIRDGGTLCVPFNMVPTWKSVFYLLFSGFRAICPCCCKPKVSKKAKTSRETNGNVSNLVSWTNHLNILKLLLLLNRISQTSKIQKNAKRTALERNRAQRTALMGNQANIR
jgi:hypothetical protein